MIKVIKVTVVSASCASRQSWKVWPVHLLLFYLLLAGFPVVAQAQANYPLWMDYTERERCYPKGEWYTGFAQGRMEAGPREADIQKGVSDAAIIKLAESLLVTITGNSQLEDAIRSLTVTRDYQRMVQVTAKATIPNMGTQLYYDSKTKELYAFAAVKRADLAAFLPQQIKMNLDRAEMVMETAKRQRSTGEKQAAQHRVDEVKQILDEVNSYRALLVAVSPGAYEKGLQTARVNKLQREVEEQLRLGFNLVVYMDCSHEFNPGDPFRKGREPRIFCDIVTQELSENNCRMTKNRNEADYVLNLVTSTTPRGDGRGSMYHYYANVKGSLNNRLTKKEDLNFFINAQDGSRDPEDAALRAFRQPELKDNALNKILPALGIANSRP